MDVYLGIASLAATEFGIVTCMYTAQNGYEKGFAGATPGILMAVAMMVVGLTGFVIKPLRDSGVMTIPELFEKKFGPRIRWAAVVVIVLGGLRSVVSAQRSLWTYLGVTGTIYLASISVLLIACCYWRRANSWGTGAAIFISAAIAITYLVSEQVTATADLAKASGPYYSGIATYLLSGTAMVVGSLLKPRSGDLRKEMA